MKASELRIGNWVKIKGYPEDEAVEQVNQLHDFFDQYPVKRINSFNPNSVEPIPLTEEWLLKFGFGRSEEHECGHNTDERFGFYYDWHFKRFTLDVSSHAISLNHIQHVHQLQNLYFALTGEELTASAP